VGHQGCTAFQAGVLFECGPVTTPHYPAGYPQTQFDEPLIPNEWAWTRATNIMFVEQPAGVGFSWGPSPRSEADLAKDFYNFMINFYDTFPHMQPKRLFLFGESYAGMYVPSMAHQMHLENRKAKRRKINLAGIGLGNGWMDATVQGPVVIDYAWWHGMIDSTTRDALKGVWEQCKAGTVEMTDPFHDFTVPDECNIMGAVLSAAGAGIFPDLMPNTYDVTTWDTYPVLDDPNSPIRLFYNDPAVKKALNAPEETTWNGCIPGAGRRQLSEKEFLPGKLLLAHDVPISVVPYIAELLDEAGIRVLIYNGDRDMSTCAQGSEMLLDGMEWSGSDEWKTASRGLWMVDEQVAGYSKSHQGLDFLIVTNSGHLVPYNVPIPALDLITRFVTNKPFSDIPLPSFAMPAETTETRTKTMTKEDNKHADGSRYSGRMLVVVAVICFVGGILASSVWPNRSSSRGNYEQVSDVEL
jgi:carboxypeptidase C (cathepsin A)